MRKSTMESEFWPTRKGRRLLNLSTATRIFVALEPVDLRQSFNGLHALMQRVLQQDPLSGHLFVFTI
jgi:hypothetical protein